MPGADSTGTAAHIALGACLAASSTAALQQPATALGHLAMDAALAGRAGYRLDWNGTWELETDLPFHDLGCAGPAPLEVVVGFELPAPVRVEKLLTAGFGLSRSAVRGAVDSGRIRLPLPVDAKAHQDFTLFVAGTPQGSHRSPAPGVTSGRLRRVADR